MTHPRALRLTLAASVLLMMSSAVEAQQCQLTIDPVQAVGGPGTPTQIIVSGIAPDCDRVDLTLTCQRSIQKTDILPDASDRWSVTLTSADIQAMGCSCPGRIAVQASCGKGPASGYCVQVTSRQSLTCQSQACPLIQDIAYTPPACSALSAGGNISTTFTATVSGNFSGMYRWNYNGQERVQSLGGTAGPPLPQTFTVNCPRTAPPYTVDLFAVGCPGGDSYYSQSRSEQVAYPACANCPQIDPISVDVSGCNAMLQTSLDGCTSGITEYIWNFGHGAPNNTASTSSPSVTHTYPSDGSYTATVTLGGVNGGQCSAQANVRISSCGGGKRPPRKDDEECGWRFWECIEFNLCWLLALLAMIIVFVRLLVLAMHDFNVGVLGTSFTLDQLLSAIGLAILIALLVICPCEVTWGILIGAVLAVIVILILLYYSAGSVPYWLKAIIVAVLLIIAAISALAIACT